MTNPPIYPTLTSLNDIPIQDSDISPQQTDLNDSMASYCMVHSSIVPVGHSTKLLGHMTTQSPPTEMNVQEQTT